MCFLHAHYLNYILTVPKADAGESILSESSVGH